jgi:hypothetical protein
MTVMMMMMRVMMMVMMIKMTTMMMMIMAKAKRIMERGQPCLTPEVKRMVVKISP